MKVKILTDTSCGILRKEVQELGYEMIALPFILDEKEYDDDKISKEEFYVKLKESKDIHTSQAPVEVVIKAFDRLLAENDYIIYLPITSGLSSSYANSLAIIDDDKYRDRVISIDHRTISVLQRSALEDIVNLLNKGIEIKKIKELVEANAKNNRIYITVDNLDYLRKGGRVSPLAAAVGNVLSIKPILFSNGGKFDVVKKSRGLKVAEEDIISLLKKDMEELFPGEPISNFVIGVAYTKDIDEANKFKAKVGEAFNCNVVMDELPSVVGCHIGAGAVASAIYKRVNEC